METTPQHHHHEPDLVRRLRARRERHRDRHVVVRLAFVVLGSILTLGGVALLVLPGPAFVVIPIGLAILSLEFEWAGRLLDSTLRRAQRARETARQTTPAQRLLTGAAAACAIGAIGAWAALGDIPVLPV